MLTYAQKKYLFAIYRLGMNGPVISSSDVSRLVGVSKAYSNCSPTSEVHAALTLLFPAHLYSDRSISLELLSVFLSDSLNYLPEKTAIMSRPKLHIFFQV